MRLVLQLGVPVTGQALERDPRGPARNQLMSDAARRIVSAAGERKAGGADVLPAVAVHDC